MIKGSRDEAGQEAPVPVKMTARDCSGIRQLMEQEEENRKEGTGADDEKTVAAARLSEYQFFHLDEMERELRIPKVVYQKAAQLIQTGEIRVDRIEVEELGVRNMLDMDGMDDPEMIVGKVWLAAGENYGLYPFYVEMIIGQRHLLRSSCWSWECHKGIYQAQDGYRRKLCVHEVAGVLLFRDYLNKHGVDATTDASRQVLQALSDQAGTEWTAGQELEQQNIELEPQLEVWDGGVLQCSFRAGNVKRYKIRNLQEFCAKMVNRESMFFTSKMTLKLSEQYLTEKAAEWYAFICGAIREDQHVQRSMIRDRYAAGASASEKGEIELCRERLDRFLELALDCQISVQFHQFGRREKSVLLLRNKKLMPQLTIRLVFSGQDASGKRGMAAGELDGIRIEGKLPELYCGIRSACWFEKGYLNRIGKSEMQALRPILAAVRADNSISLPVGRMNLSEFYYKALPQLRRIAEVTEENSTLVTEYLLPESAFTIYLDIDNNAFLCRAEAAYGQEIFSLSDVLFLKNAVFPDGMSASSEETFREAARVQARSGQSKRASSYQQYRDRREEERIVREIRKYFLDYDGDLEIFYVMRDAEEAFDLLDHGLDELAEIAGESKNHIEIYFDTGAVRKIICSPTTSKLDLEYPKKYEGDIYPNFHKVQMSDIPFRVI